MILDPTPALLDNLYWITLFAVIVSSASAVLMAGFKQFDLFGVIIIAIATGLGGAIAVFLAARLMTISHRLILIGWYYDLRGDKIANVDEISASMLSGCKG